MNRFDEALGEIVEQSPAPGSTLVPAAPKPDDPFTSALDAVIGDDTGARQARIKVAGTQADDLTPDRAADVYRLSRKYGLSPAMVERNFADIQRRARHDDTPYAKMLRETPALADYLSDPIQAAAVKEDVEPLAILENTVRVTANSMRALASGIPRFNASLWGVIESGAEMAGIPQLAAVAKTYRLSGMADADFTKGAQTGSGELEKAFYAGWESLGLMAPGAIMSAMTLTPAPMLTAMGAATAGESYGRGRDRGLTPARANLFALSQASVEVATEMIPASLWLKDLAGNAGFRKMVLHQLGAEIPGEQLATALQDLDEWATFNPQAPFMDYVRARPEAFVQTLVSTITSVGAMSTIASTAQRLAGDNGKAERAAESKGFFDAIAQAVGSMKSAEKFPESIETVLANAAAGGPIEKLYAPIDTFTTYWQSQNEDPETMATQLTGDPDAYANAVTSGADLAIPTATYAARLASSDHHAFFVNELRLGPEEMNIRESETFKAAQTAQAAEPAMPVESPTAAIRQALTEQLVGAGVEQGTAASYVDLLESTFGKQANILGADPVAFFQRYGITVDRPDLSNPAAHAAVQSDAQQVIADLVTSRVEAGAAARAQSADVPDNEAARQLEAERNLPETGDEPGVVVPITAKPDTDVPTEDDVSFGEWAQNASRVAADPMKATSKDLRRAANFLANRQQVIAIRAQKAGTTPDPTIWHGFTNEIAWYDRLANEKDAALLDKKTPTAQTTGGTTNAAAEPIPNRVADQGRVPAGVRVPASDPGTGKKANERYDKHIGRVFDAVLANARALDPNVNEQELRQEFDFRVEFYRDQRTLAAESGLQPHAILRAIATYGGISIDPKAERSAEIRQLRDAGTAFGAVAGVRGVFRKPKVITKAGQGKGGGVPIDVMLQMLQADPEFAWIESIDLLLDNIDEAMRHGADTISKTELPGTEELRDVGILAERQWWVRGWAPQDMLEDVDERDIEGAEGDTSFDVREFNQSLFDEFDALEEPAGGDTLATGERQPRLPEAGQVRDREVATPEIAELPFSLTAPVAKPEKKNAGQRTLFQTFSGTQEAVRAWAADLKNRFGPDLRVFDVELTAGGDLNLVGLVVARGAQRAGLGSNVMRELTRFADREGFRIILSPAEKGDLGGTTSRARLLKFYQRFGFVENKGRHKDWNLSAGMLREPTVPRQFDQALFYGSPHNFDRFSLQHIGTGEGAQSYGWGLYFAENPAIAAHYFDTLSDDPQIVEMKLGSMRVNQRNNFDYSSRAAESNVENIRASLAEDMLGAPLDVMAATPAGFQKMVLARLDERIDDYKKEWPEGVAAAEALRAELEKPGAVTVKWDERQGGIYQVEIDDKHIPAMLQWDRPASEQSPQVQEALKKLGIEWTPITVKTPRQMAAWFRTLHAQRLWAEDIGIRESLREAKQYLEAALAGDRQAADSLMFWQQQHQGYFSKGMIDPTGQVIYNELADRALAEARKDKSIPAVGYEKGPELASKQLVAAGVVGLRYLDNSSRGTGKGTQNVVVFDESIITLTHKDGKPFTAKERREYFQGEDDAEPGEADKRGAIRFGPGQQISISLLAKADLSTFLHESGHLFLEVFGDVADQLRDVEAPTDQQRQALTDYDTLLKWLGVENRDAIGDEQHEKFARGFEAYLMEGKAPSPQLRAAFSRFRAWLLGIYRSLKGLRVELSDDVRRVLDRMVASDAAIAQAEQDAKITPMFTTAESAGVSPAEFELYRQGIAEASNAARETLELQVLAEVQREQQATWKTQREEIRQAVEAETHAMPVYVAIAAMQRGETPAGEPMIEGMVTPPIKLSRTMLVSRFGADRLKRLPRLYIYSREGGVDPETAAGMFGFTSADEFLQAVEDAEPMGRRIERETDRRMLERHGSLLLDGTLQEKAQAALANEQRETIVREELRALGRLRRAAKPFVEAGQAALAAEQRERAYERRWLEAEAKLRIAIAAGRKQAEIDTLRNELVGLKAQARGGAARIDAALPPRSVILEAAQLAVSRMKVREIRPEVYWSAARRAAKKALDAAATQDFDTAIVEKQHELMSLAVFREATRVKAETDARVQRALDLAKPAARARLGKAGGSYLEQVDALLDRYDFARLPGTVLDRRESLRVWVQALQAQGMPVEIADEVLDDTRRIHYSELTVEELIGVSDALDHLVHLARLKNKLLKIVQAGELKETAEELARSIRAHFTGRASSVLETHLPAEQTKRTIAGFFASHRKLASLAREIDGFEDGGPLWEALIRPLNEAADRETQMNAAATRALGAIVKKAFPGREKVRLYDKTHIPAIGTSLTKMGRLMVALNWGNDGNRQRIRDGYKWSDAQVQAILDTLDERDWHFVQDVWTFIGSYWDEIAAKQQRVTGVVPARVESIPVPTKFGQFNGGYFPLKYNERLEAQAGAHLDLEAGNLQKQAAYVNATTKRGHTKERVRNVKMKVRLDFGVLFEHVGQVIHDLSHHEMLIDVGRVIGHREVQKAIYETHGEVVYREIKDGLRDVAFGVVPAVKFHEKAFNHLRVGATIAGLGWNLTTAMLQPVGLTQSMVRIGPQWVARGAYRWLRDAATMENTVAWIADRSPMMRLRGQTQQREINEIRNQVGVNTGQLAGWIDAVLSKTTFDTVGRQGIADSFFFLIQQMQRIADVPTWLGEYEKQMAAGETEARAAALADQAVLDAQGGGQVKDLAGVQRGGPMLRLWTNFYSFFNTTYNLTAESTKRTNFRKPGAVARLAVDYLLLYTVPAVIAYTIRQALKPGDDDDDSLVESLIRENVAYLMGTIVGLREAAGTVQGYYGYEGPAGARGFAAMGRLLKQAEQVVTSDDPADQLDAAFWRSLNDTAGILFHYPSGQTRRTIEGIAAIAEGETTNPGAVLVGAPKK